MRAATCADLLCRKKVLFYYLDLYVKPLKQKQNLIPTASINIQETSRTYAMIN